MGECLGTWTGGEWGGVWGHLSLYSKAKYCGQEGLEVCVTGAEDPSAVGNTLKLNHKFVNLSGYLEGEGTSVALEVEEG